MKILDCTYALEVIWGHFYLLERQLNRLDELSLLLDKFWNCLNELVTLSKTLLGKALTYARGQKGGFQVEAHQDGMLYQFR